MGALELAIQYSEKMATCKTVKELDVVGQEIKSDIKNLEGWVEWLRLEYMSKRDALNAPKIPIEDTLNKEGKKALKNKKIPEFII